MLWPSIDKISKVRMLVFWMILLREKRKKEIFVGNPRVIIGKHALKTF